MERVPSSEPPPEAPLCTSPDARKERRTGCVKAAAGARVAGRNAAKSLYSAEHRSILMTRCIVPRAPVCGARQQTRSWAEMALSLLRGEYQALRGLFVGGTLLARRPGPILASGVAPGLRTHLARHPASAVSNEKLSAFALSAAVRLLSSPSRADFCCSSTRSISSASTFARCRSFSSAQTTRWTILSFTLSPIAKIRGITGKPAGRDRRTRQATASSAVSGQRCGRSRGGGSAVVAEWVVGRFAI